MNLTVRVGSLTLPNPVTVASGTFGYGAEYARLIDLNQLGAVVVKGIRLEPVKGNPTPRTVEVSSGLINAIGLQGPGVDGFIEKYWPFLKGLQVPTIINIWGKTVEEYAEVARRFDALGGVGALELNVSCPNIKEGGAQFGTDVRLLSQVVAACRAVTRLPLITKMSPNVVSIAPYAQAAEAAGSDALSIMNSFPAMAIDIKTRRPKLANVTGGLTGPCIKPIALKLVWEAVLRPQVIWPMLTAFLPKTVPTAPMMPGTSSFSMMMRLPSGTALKCLSFRITMRGILRVSSDPAT